MHVGVWEVSLLEKQTVARGNTGKRKVGFDSGNLRRLS